MRIHHFGASLCLCIPLIFTACREKDGNGGKTRVVTDMMGRKVAIPVEVRRVVGLPDAVNEWMLLLGHPEKMVGIYASFQKNPWVQRIYPEVAKMPVPFANSDAANEEVLLKIRPQLAIELKGHTSESFKKLGIPTLELERRDFKELEEGLRIAGDALGPDEKAAAGRFCAYFDSNVAYVRARTDALPASRRPRVLYVHGSSHGTSTEGKGTLVQSWIEAAGGRNIAADSGFEGMGNNNVVPMEQILRWNPQVVVCMTEKIRQEILGNPQWACVQAVRDGKVFVNPKGIFFWCTRGADEAMQVLWAAKTIHPELFADLDLVARTKSFYQRFYRYDLTKDQALLMLEGKNP